MVIFKQKVPISILDYLSWMILTLGFPDIKYMDVEIYMEQTEGS